MELKEMRDLMTKFVRTHLEPVLPKNTTLHYWANTGWNGVNQCFYLDIHVYRGLNRKKVRIIKDAICISEKEICLCGHGGYYSKRYAIKTTGDRIVNYILAVMKNEDY